MSDPRVLFEDEHFIAIDKPSGLLVHPSWIAPRKTPNAVAWLKGYLGSTVYTIHRLDRATSGVILFGKHKEAAQAMNLAFSERRVRKTYLCVTRGHTPEEGIIDYPLKPIHDKKADPFADPDKPAKEAVSEFRRLGTVELPIPVGRYETARYSLVEVRPHTGRKHQIRRHMKHIFHPLVGDTKHGDGKHNLLFRERFGLQRLLLMATELEFRHPFTGQTKRICSGVDDYSDSLFRELGWTGLYPR
ncbi:pseudouridine synthase [Marinobacterium aestuariivivens]|uniref:tRNA pseudouridine synthase C n=1 Tax=Marinobacterium aestuariivivens TaxID=1698799 RepID=A0ABW2A6N3_9GAMM